MFAKEKDLHGKRTYLVATLPQFWYKYTRYGLRKGKKLKHFPCDVGLSPLCVPSFGCLTIIPETSQFSVIIHTN